MEKVPLYVSLFFGLITLLTVFLFYRASNRSRTTGTVLLVLLAMQAMVGLSGFFTVTDTTPPRFLLLLMPPLLCIVVLFTTKKGRHYLDRFDTKGLILLHTIRVPVEIGLFILCSYKVIPQLMTFEGRNFDIIAGLTAPLIYYFGFVKNKISPRIVLAWNFICLALLANIVLNAVFAAPFPFQRFGFEQPNIAVLYFPYVWLPGCVVPLVLFSHLTATRQLLKNRTEKTAHKHPATMTKAVINK
jgi:hypothetical protein